MKFDSIIRFLVIGCSDLFDGWKVCVLIVVKYFYSIIVIVFL